MTSLRITSLVWLAAFTAFGQPAFEVASVKPSTEQDHIIGLFTYPGGWIVATQFTLKMLIHDASNPDPKNGLYAFFKGGDARMLQVMKAAYEAKAKN